MKKIIYIICIFMFLVCGCSNNQDKEKEAVLTQADTPTPTSTVEFGRVGTDETLFENSDMITVTSIEEFIDIINETDTSKKSDGNFMSQSIERIKKDGYVLYPFIDGKAAEMETGVFYPSRYGETALLPAEFLCNATGGEYQFRIYIYYLDSSEEVEAAKNFGSNGFMEARRGKTLDQIRERKE